MCNLYSHTKGPQAILEFTRAMIDRTGNLAPQPSIFPDYMAPIVRNTAEERELTRARWGMPSSQKAIFEATQKRARGDLPRPSRPCHLDQRSRVVIPMREDHDER